MESPRTGSAHVRAHRYARQRLDRALTLGTPLPGDDPGRAARRGIVASGALAIALLAVAGVLAIARPAPDWSSAQVLVVDGSGAVFVNRGGVLHPSLNLTSALLAAAGSTPVAPMQVSADDISSAPRGPTLGIAGAPAVLPSSRQLVTDGWSLCDTLRASDGAVVTTAVIGAPPPGVRVPPDLAVFVVPDAADTPERSAFLLIGGHRIPIDRDDRPLLLALGLAEAVPRPVSAALLDAMPEVLPQIDGPLEGAGAPGAVDLPDATGHPVPVGAVLRVARADGTVSLYLVHRDGIETVTPVIADLVLARWSAVLVPVDPWRLALLPQTREPVMAGSPLPPVAPLLLPRQTPVLCAAWQGATVGWTLTSGTALDGAVPVSPVETAHGPLDQVQIGPGRGAVARAVGPDADGTPTVLVTDLGIAFPVAEDVPSRLGLLEAGAVPAAAPAAVLDLLPRGPALTTDDAGRPWDYSEAEAEAEADADADADADAGAGRGPVGPPSS